MSHGIAITRLRHVHGPTENGRLDTGWQSTDSFVRRGSGDESIVDLPDAEIEKIVLADLRRVMDIKGDPEFTVVSRWKGMPQYTVGHRDRLVAARAEL